MRKILILIVCLVSLFMVSCKKEYKGSKNESVDEKLENINAQLTYADLQLNGLLDLAKNKNKNPRTIEPDSSIYFINSDKFDWTEGFFPGSCWYLYEGTRIEKWKKAASHFQELFKNHKDWPQYHDLGFVFNCSYGNGYRITQDTTYKKVLLDAAKTLATRFDTKIGVIKSWDVDKGWQADRGWQYPVIIDNMMNLELLFNASIMSGNDDYKNIAISHADKTLKNHFRSNYSSYHVVDYDSISGQVLSKETAQGYSDESSWARGQAWGLYGFTLCYRYTKDEAYLNQAKKIANLILTSDAIPSDRIPYWDYDVDEKEHAPRDVSAAAITVSALIELNTYTNGDYENITNEILNVLSSEKYRAKIGENKHFLLKHSVGSIPHNSEIDVPLNYADYYYLEALIRAKKYYSTNTNPLKN
ncbi:glucuronyl hydrolase [Formosa sediminum]|uniref:Glucuronyl hydrolase n=1 Tax=Formosa sediminum TaxID=2594004 RepID=A0A516GUL9_9FLAO|nr:glycoside hydrolase family 88 protein [Formosa sediminum]QDO95223.1 glucuronyl hydrolase [Formosa sediminum]